MGDLASVPRRGTACNLLGHARHPALRQARLVTWPTRFQTSTQRGRWESRALDHLDLSRLSCGRASSRGSFRSESTLKLGLVSLGAEAVASSEQRVERQ